MKVKVTPEQKAQLRLLSDGELYRDAVSFVHKSLIVDNKQMANLLKNYRSWKELRKFVKEQTGGDWQGARTHYSNFYTELEKELDKLRDEVKNKHAFVPNGLTEEQSKER